jgi:hypothetical protein
MSIPSPQPGSEDRVKKDPRDFESDIFFPDLLSPDTCRPTWRKLRGLLQVLEAILLS